MVLVADGARPDAFAGELAHAPALARLRDESGSHTISTVFPSVTGPAYTPFLLGRFPGEVGIPGIRWYDRSRTACGWPDYARSYVGPQMMRLDDDLDEAAPTMFELEPDSLGAFSLFTRGLAPERRLGALGARLALRAASTHFRGRAERWLTVDRELGDAVVARVRDAQPAFVFAAFTGIDKASHARGHESALAQAAISIVDDVVARLREDAERAGRWRDTLLLVVSDHGHASVHSHEDLA
ncbi:MAG: alkaline phosphatase family protein, partial [Geodermatophilaceae bacterium]|nr:alkaline phosphatase family protein [Geodermatophilaceae bacterium]